MEYRYRVVDFDNEITSSEELLSLAKEKKFIASAEVRLTNKGEIVIDKQDKNYQAWNHFNGDYSEDKAKKILDWLHSQNIHLYHEKEIVTQPLFAEDLDEAWADIFDLNLNDEDRYGYDIYAYVLYQMKRKLTQLGYEIVKV